MSETQGALQCGHSRDTYPAYQDADGKVWAKVALAEDQATAPWRPVLPGSFTTFLPRAVPEPLRRADFTPFVG